MQEAEEEEFVAEVRRLGEGHVSHSLQREIEEQLLVIGNNGSRGGQVFRGQGGGGRGGGGSGGTCRRPTAIGKETTRRPRSWGPQPGDALSWLLWQPYDVQCQPSRHGVDNMSQCNVSVVPVVTTSSVDQQQNQRTYISTEAQTEDLPPPPRSNRRRRHRLPDLLDSHLPPPYTAPQPLPLPFHIVPSRRRGSVYREVPKSCCGLLSPAAVSLRWLMLLLLTVGVCCALVGTVLGATRATAPHHLTVSLLMIGVGVVLVTVSGVAWRLMSHEAPPWRSMFGFTSGSEAADPNRRFLPRLPPSYGRPHHPYAAMMYPEFQYRAPPPSYQASMQEYRLRLLLLDRHSAASPPPTYRSHPPTLLRRGGLMVGGGDYSRPPSYRSRTSSCRPDLPPIDHSRQASSVLSSVHNLNISTSHVKEELTKDNVKENVVTIVQTAEEPTGPVIVTISGPPEPLIHCPRTDQMEILAHL